MEDIAQMKTKTLYQFKVSGFEDAKLIVDTAKKHCQVQPQDEVSKATASEQDISLVVQQYSRTKLMNVSPSILDVVCKQLDPGGEGLKSWEAFGEALLGLTVVEVREFRGYRPSPTKAIIDRKMGNDPDASLSDIIDVLEKIGRREVVRLLEEKISSLPPPLAKQSSNHGAQPLTREASLPRNRHVPHQGSSSLDSGFDPTEEREAFEPQSVPPQRSAYQSQSSRSYSTDSELNNSYRAAPISSTGTVSANLPSVSDSANSLSGSLEPWESRLPHPQVAMSTGHLTPSLSQVVAGGGVGDPGVDFDHFRHSQPQSLVMPTQQASAKVMGTVSDVEQLRDTFRQMTLDGGQTINLTCTVINSNTNTPIPHNAANLSHAHARTTAAESPVLRDITPVQRLKQFSSNEVPIGTDIHVKISADRPCYLYIVNIGTSGSVAKLLPNQYQRDNFLPVGRTFCLPADNYSLTISGPAGKEIIQVMAFSRPLDDLPAFSRRPDSFPSDGQVLRNIEVVQQRLESYEQWGFAQMEFLVVTN